MRKKRERVWSRRHASAAKGERTQGLGFVESIGGHWHQQIQSAHLECTRPLKWVVHSAETHEGRIFDCPRVHRVALLRPLNTASRFSPCCFLWFSSPVSLSVPQRCPDSEGKKRQKKERGKRIGKRNQRRREKRLVNFSPTWVLFKPFFTNFSFLFRAFFSQPLFPLFPLRVDRVNASPRFTEYQNRFSLEFFSGFSQIYLPKKMSQRLGIFFQLF